MAPLDLLRNEALNLTDSLKRIEEHARSREEEFQKIENSKRRDILSLISKVHELQPPAESSSKTPEFISALDDAISALKPWRKGPFNLFGIEIDAEWRSDWKFERLKLTKDKIEGKRVGDVGCGNGYYMFRLLELNPELVVGFDPTNRYLIQYLFLRGFLKSESRLLFEPFRSDALRFYPTFFDTLLCLGVLYHHPNPEILLKELYNSIRSGGMLYLETLYSPENNSLRFTGIERYAEMKNVYLIPNFSDLSKLLEDVGFNKLEILHQGILSTEEQRTTPFSPGRSLVDFIDPQDPLLTLEGLPRPHRMIVKAQR